MRKISFVAACGLILAGVLLVAGVDPFAGQAPTAATVPSATASATPSQTAGGTRDPRTPIAPGYRIQIPRLGIDLPIAEGDIARDIDQQRTPESYAFHLPGTGIPGGGSNTYLYAHARQGMFLTLWDARVGDEILLSTPDHRLLRYVVVEIHPKVSPDDVSWVQPTPTERLTLQTSTGPVPSDPRFVVVAAPAT